MDCELNDELIQEGLAREVVNRIQRSRRELGLNVTDRITLTVSATEQLDRAIFAHQGYIMKETLATVMERGDVTENLLFIIDDHKLELIIQKTSV